MSPGQQHMQRQLARSARLNDKIDAAGDKLVDGLSKASRTVVYRSAKTGSYVSQRAARSKPASTVRERRK